MLPGRPGRAQPYTAFTATMRPFPANRSVLLGNTTNEGPTHRHTHTRTHTHRHTHTHTHTCTHSLTHIHTRRAVPFGPHTQDQTEVRPFTTTSKTEPRPTTSNLLSKEGKHTRKTIFALAGGTRSCLCVHIFRTPSGNRASLQRLRNAIHWPTVCTHTHNTHTHTKSTISGLSHQHKSIGTTPEP